MKIILSRKGFDSLTGKRPSFITQNGKLVSFPIPDTPSAQHKTTYQAITTPIGFLGPILPLINARTKQTKSQPSQPLLGHHLAHLDPDLLQSSITRNGTWIGAFGQRNPREVAMLIKHGVGHGDLFLFFGRFKKQSQTFPHPPYERGAPKLHVVFGYLQVEAVYQNSQIQQLLQLYPGLSDHAHVCAPRNAVPNNRIFVAKQALSIPGVSSQLPGWGLFDYDPKRVLTRPGQSCRRWLLRNIGKNSSQQPPFCRPVGKFDDWRKVGDDWEVTDFGYGQEFLIDTERFPDALIWAQTFSDLLAFLPVR